METILIILVVTLGFFFAMSKLEQSRTENLNRINLEYQKSINELADSVATYTIETNENEEETKISNIEVTISGAILHEGSYQLEKGSILEDLLEKAILKDDADRETFNLYYVLKDKDNIFIPSYGDGNKISINTASAETLDLLPGIGVTLASRIVEYREANGSFELLEQLMNIDGLGKSVFEKLKIYVKL